MGGRSGGVALALLTESFAVRALLGSLAAAVLATVAVRAGFAASVSGRRLLVLTPALAAAAAGVATAVQSTAYLPELMVLPASAAGELNDLVSTFAQDRPRNILLLVHGVIAGTLLTRRALGVYAVRRVVARGRAPGGQDRRIVTTVRRLAPRVGVDVPRLVLVPDCPGGAFAAGSFRPVLGVDPALVTTLDDGELEGLLAHELAHVRRRDPLLCLILGAFQDLTFFLPTVSMAARWLRREQEESADEIAAKVTARPAALASGLLKVWQRSAAAGPHVACAAVPPRPAVAGVPRMGALALSDGAQLIALRVERLIAGHRALSRRRSNAEMALAAAVLSVGLVGALTVPGWIVERTDANQIWVPILTSGGAVADQPAESPAFSTFRAVTETDVVAPDPATPATSAVEETGCPCIETQAQLRAAVGATAPASNPHLEWSPSGERDFALTDPPRTRAVLTLDQGPRMGVFLVGEGPPGQ